MHLSCSSIDSFFRSKTVRAIVAQNLCTPILLGAPFLSHNKIIIDHELRNCVVKEINYDLLHPKPLPSPKPSNADLLDIYTAKKAVVQELNNILPELKDIVDESCEPIHEANIVAAIHQRIVALATLEDLLQRDGIAKTEFADRFPDDIPHNDLLPNDVLFRIKLKDADKIIHSRSYNCLQKYHAAWKMLLDQHIAAGPLRPSSSMHSSPAFIIPKPDPTVLPRWVNDYRQLNLNTVPDNHPLPRIDKILRDCTKGKIFGKIDMTNSFFQMKVHPDDIHLMATLTPWGLYEWMVMPMGVRNAPACHQR